MNNIGQRIKLLCIQREITYTELAEKSKVALKTINNILNNRISPRESTLKRLTQVLDTTVEEILSSELHEIEKELSIQHVGENLKRICMEKKMSYADLERKSGVTRRTMYNAMNHIRCTRISIIMLWADALGVTSYELMKQPAES